VHVPYGWLFKRSAAVIHHGGAGTTGKGLTAGVPNIVLPFTSDQPFWGRRVQLLGAGPKPIPAKRLSVSELTKAINLAVNDADMRKQARLVGEALQREDGVARAVDILEKYNKLYPR
jgi:UDP:flavonoid glycosyltransferase YjiC (YdhE family)